MKALILLVLSGSLVMGTCFGCRGIRQTSMSSEDLYRNVIVPKTDMVDVTFLDAMDRLNEIYRELREKHMEAGKCTVTCTQFPGLHYVVRPLSEGMKSARLSIHLENVTLTEAFKCVVGNFGLTLAHESDSFKSGCFIITDPNYKSEPDDDTFIERK